MLLQEFPKRTAVEFRRFRSLRDVPAALAQDLFKVCPFEGRNGAGLVLPERTGVRRRRWRRQDDIGCLDDGALGRDLGPNKDMLQFPHVSRPPMSSQFFPGRATQGSG